MSATEIRASFTLRKHHQLFEQFTTSLFVKLPTKLRSRSSYNAIYV